jgi:FkbM family methyltransferase
MLSKFFRRILTAPVPIGGKESYAQCGEDMIVAYILEVNLGIKNPSYLDIGAHHPSYLSNTFYFYRLGFKGILVEPDPQQFEVIKAARSRDTCLNVGMGIGDATTADFYVMDDRGLSTFSKAKVESYTRSGIHVAKILRVPLVTVEEVVKRYATSTPNFVSIDTEGLDMDILKSIDFTQFRPQIICVETMDHEHQTKTDAFSNLLSQNDYIVHSDTYLNTIFVEKTAWANRRGRSKSEERPNGNN